MDDVTADDIVDQLRQKYKFIPHKHIHIHIHTQPQILFTYLPPSLSFSFLYRHPPYRVSGVVAVNATHFGKFSRMSELSFYLTEMALRLEIKNILKIKRNNSLFSFSFSGLPTFLMQSQEVFIHSKLNFRFIHRKISLSIYLELWICLFKELTPTTYRPSPPTITRQSPLQGFRGYLWMISKNIWWKGAERVMMQKKHWIY